MAHLAKFSGNYVDLSPEMGAPDSKLRHLRIKAIIIPGSKLKFEI
jgi:hypothetical protein